MDRALEKMNATIKVKGLKKAYLKYLIKHLAEEHKKTKGRLSLGNLGGVKR